MATLTPGVRATLLRDFAAALDRHATDPAAACDAVMRLRDRAGCTWHDLLDHPGRDPAYSTGLIAYGHGRTSGITAADAGAAVLHLAAWTSPHVLAAVAVAVHLPTMNPDGTLDRLFGLVLRLATARDCGGTGPHPIAWTPRSPTTAPGLPWM